MKKIWSILLVLALLCIFLSGCYEIDSNEKTDYPQFYEKMRTVMPTTYAMLPAPECIESIDDIYLYYSDYDLLDSYYTIYLECSFVPETYSTEKQRIIDEAKQYDFAVYNADVFSYDSVYIDQSIEHDSDGLLAIQISYVLFDSENSRIIYVDTFEEGRKYEWNTAHIPDKYLPKDLIGFIS